MQQVLDISILCTQILSSVGSDFKLSSSTYAAEIKIIVLFKTISLKFMAFYTVYVHYV